MIWKLIQVIYKNRLWAMCSDQYCRGVEDGVNQMHHEPASVMWMVVDQDQYWGPRD